MSNPNARCQLRCANPTCHFTVHENPSFGGFCCLKCHFCWEGCLRPKRKHGPNCAQNYAEREWEQADPIRPTILDDAEQPADSKQCRGMSRKGRRRGRRSRSCHDRACGEPANPKRYRSRSRGRRRRGLRSLSGHAKGDRVPHNVGNGVDAHAGRGRRLQCFAVDQVRFSQKECSSKFKDGRLLSDLINDLNSGAVNPTVAQFLHLDGFIDSVGVPWSTDNRRLWCLKQHQESVRPGVVHVHLHVGGRISQRQSCKFDRGHDGRTCRVRSKSRSTSRSAAGSGSASPQRTACNSGVGRSTSRPRSTSRTRSHQWEPGGRDLRELRIKLLQKSLRPKGRGTWARALEAVGAIHASRRNCQERRADLKPVPEPSPSHRRVAFSSRATELPQSEGDCISVASTISGV